MARLDVERRRSPFMGWMWGILVVVGVIVLAWWFWPNTPENYVGGPRTESGVAPAAEVEPGTTPGAAAASATVIPVVNIADDPGAWMNQHVAGRATIAEQATPQGIWLDQDGRRIFTVFQQEPPAGTDLRSGTEIRLSDAVVRSPSSLSDLSGTVDVQTVRMANTQDVVLVVPPNGLATGSVGGPGTTGTTTDTGATTTGAGSTAGHR